MRLLIAEDEVDLAEALTVFFEKNHFSVDAVHNGFDAYEYASSGAYDAVILDVMMPKMDGIQVLEKLRQEGACENLGIGLAMEGKKVLLVDTDPQGSLTISMGWQQPDELPTTLSTLMQKAMNDQSIQPGEGILHHAEGVDLIPANIELAGLEVALVNSMNREKMLKQVLDSAKREYDFILLDCMPSLGMLTINALAAADATLIPVQAQYLSAKGLEQLLQTVQKVRRQINPKLKIEGILLTMTDSRTNYLHLNSLTA